VSNGAPNGWAGFWLQKQVAAIGILLALLIGIPSAFAFHGRTDSADVFYVSVTGSDSSDGSFNTPWRTVQHALDMLQPAQTVFVRAGTYNEFIEFQRSGKLGAPIVLSGYPGETAVLDGTGLNWRYGVNLQSFDNLVVENLTIRDYIRDGERGFGIVGWGDTDNIVLRDLSISLVGTPIKIAADGGTDVRSNITIENIIAAGYEWGGIDLGPGAVSNVIVRNVQLMGQPGGDNTAIDGIAVEDGNQITVEKAIIRGHAGDGVDLKADNVAVRQVDARGHSRNGLKLWGANATAENSLFVGGELESLVLKSGPCTVRNNLFGTAPGHGYTAVIGPYEPPPRTPSVSITMRGNIFYTTRNTGTLIYFSPVASLDAKFNLYYSPQRTDAVLQAYAGGVARTFSAAEINDGTWASAMGTDQQSKHEDPLLVNPNAGDYQLQAGSPAIDAMPTALAPPTDLLGTARPQGSCADIGPYEFMTSFDFSLSNSGRVTVVQGGSGSNMITTTLLGGSTEPVSLSCMSGIPSGASCSFIPVSADPTFQSTLTITTSTSTPTGSYTITVTGTGGGQTHTTQFTLTVNPHLPQLSVTPVSPPSPSEGATVTSSPVKIKIQVTNGGVSVKSASVAVYVDGSPASSCSGASNLYGYFVCSFSPTQSGHMYSWYATAAKSGYATGTSATWTFTYTVYAVVLLQPENDTVVTSPVKLAVKVTYQGVGMVGATVYFYVDGVLVKTKSTNTYGRAAFSFYTTPGTHSWYVIVQSTYGSTTSEICSFTL